MTSGYFFSRISPKASPSGENARTQVSSHRVCKQTLLTGEGYIQINPPHGGGSVASGFALAANSVAVISPFPNSLYSHFAYVFPNPLAFAPERARCARARLRRATSTQCIPPQLKILIYLQTIMKTSRLQVLQHHLTVGDAVPYKLRWDSVRSHGDI